jgi:hypothetical protein
LLARIDAGSVPRVTRPPTAADQERLAELPFVVLALALARDTELTDEEIAAAERGLNTLDIPELMTAVRSMSHSPTELFELAWLEEPPEQAVSQGSALLPSLFGDARAVALRRSLLELADRVTSASDRPLRRSDEPRAARLDRVRLALGLD